MPHPVVHAEIRSQDPDATRRFFADLFGWEVAAEGALPGYTFINTGVDGGTFVAIGPRQGPGDEVLFFVRGARCCGHTGEGRGAGRNHHSACSTSTGNEFRCLLRRPGSQDRCCGERVAHTSPSPEVGRDLRPTVDQSVYLASVKQPDRRVGGPCLDRIGLSRSQRSPRPLAHLGS